MHYSGTIWRPPYEAYSALVQVTAGCTHHKCKFCTLYEDVPFKFRMSPLSEVEEDLKEISRYHRNAKRVFFTGANPFVLSFDKLKTLAELVKKYYPNVQSIGCFARITDITPKTTEQLRELRQLGYNSITIGAEAGDEESLSFMHKGFGTKEIIAESKRLDEVGMERCVIYWKSLILQQDRYLLADQDRCLSLCQHGQKNIVSRFKFLWKNGWHVALVPV